MFVRSLAGLTLGLVFGDGPVDARGRFDGQFARNRGAVCGIQVDAPSGYAVDQCGGVGVVGAVCGIAGTGPPQPASATMMGLMQSSSSSEKMR